MPRMEYSTNRYSADFPKNFQDEESAVIFVLFEVEAAIFMANFWTKAPFIVVTHHEEKKSLTFH